MYISHLGEDMMWMPISFISFMDFFSGKEGVTDLGGTPPPLQIFPQKKFFKKG